MHWQRKALCIIERSVNIKARRLALPCQTLNSVRTLVHILLPINLVVYGPGEASAANGALQTAGAAILLQLPPLPTVGMKRLRGRAPNGACTPSVRPPHSHTRPPACADESGNPMHWDIRVGGWRPTE